MNEVDDIRRPFPPQ